MVRTSATSPEAPSKPESRERRVLVETFSIDTRALSVVRVLLAGLILFQVLVLDPAERGDPSSLGEFLARYGHVMVVPFAVMMLVGYKTRLAIVLTWLTYSLPLRASLTGGLEIPQGYYILNIVLFWCMFLPLGRHLSIDSRERGFPPLRYLSVASGALLFQVFIIYFSAGLVKDVNEWLGQANAMELILSVPRYQTALGAALLAYPAVLAVMSVATVLMEVVGSLLVIFPGRSLARRRMVIVPVFLLFHAGIAAVMGLGLFPYVMIAAWLLFMPPSFWDRVWPLFRLGSAPAEGHVDGSVVRNLVVSFAVLVCAMSFAFVWLYHPNYEGFTAHFDEFSRYLLLYQKWFMFSLPSAIT